MKKWKKILLAVIFVILLLIAGAGVYAYSVYHQVEKAADKTHESVERLTPAKRKSAPSITANKKDAFSVLLLGVDTGDLGRTEQGRSDTILVATVNPKDKQTTLVSVPRDTYTEIVGNGTTDKINHAYAFGGVPMSIASVEKLFDIPIDHYVSINMKGLVDLVDAVGGVTVNNPFEFTFDGKTFPAGTNELDGDSALKYSRMRHEDPNGDYGRQERQRQVITAVAKKALTVKNIPNINQMLGVLSENMKTDLTFDEMRTIGTDYHDAFENVKSLQLKGTGFTGDGTRGEAGISYQEISEKELKNVQKVLNEQLAE